MVGTSSDRSRPATTMVAADPQSKGCGIPTPVTACLALSRTTGCISGYYVRERHWRVSYITSVEVRVRRALAELFANLIEVVSGAMSKKSKTGISRYFSKLSMSKKSKPPIGVGLWTEFFRHRVTATAKLLRCRQWLTASACCPW